MTSPPPWDLVAESVVSTPPRTGEWGCRMGWMEMGLLMFPLSGPEDAPGPSAHRPYDLPHFLRGHL